MGLIPRKGNKGLSLLWVLGTKTRPACRPRSLDMRPGTSSRAQSRAARMSGDFSAFIGFVCVYLEGSWVDRSRVLSTLNKEVIIAVLGQLRF